MALYGTLIAGHRAGRIEPGAWTPPDGDWVVLIGSEDPLAEEEVEIGDYFGLEQSIDLTAVMLITLGMKFRNTVTAAIDFKVSVLVGGAEVWSDQISHGETRDYTRRTINVYDQVGAQLVEVRLEAVAP